jgi:hypothetical protein
VDNADIKRLTAVDTGFVKKYKIRGEGEVVRSDNIRERM